MTVAVMVIVVTTEVGWDRDNGVRVRYLGEAEYCKRWLLGKIISFPHSCAPISHSIKPCPPFDN